MNRLLPFNWELMSGNRRLWALTAYWNIVSIENEDRGEAAQVKSLSLSCKTREPAESSSKSPWKTLNPLELPSRKVLLWKSGWSLAWLGCAWTGTCDVPMTSMSTLGLTLSISVFHTMTCALTPACLLLENKSLGWVKCQRHVRPFSFFNSLKKKN